VVGFIGASIIFFFVAKVLMRYDSHLNPADYDMVGVLGTVTVPIREGGTGEIVFSQEGARRCTGARSDNAGPISKGTEVVVTRYERGIAYVQRWDELSGAAQESEQEKGRKQ
jgi:membrane protein implicated in regulation of membrane protease activity